MKHIFSIILATIAFSACNDGDNQVAVDISISEDTVDIVATSQILTPEKVVKVSIAPKAGFAASLGHILMLSGNGDIYSSNTGFGGVMDIVDGEYVDILGLPQGESPSIFLALNKAGEIKPFLENKREGFDAMPLSSDNLKADGFCQMEIPSNDTVYLIEDGKLQKLNYKVKAGTALELIKIDTPKIKAVSTCYVSESGDIYTSGPGGNLRLTGDGNTKFPKGIISAAVLNSDQTLLQTSSGNLLAKHYGETIPLKITAGFSIPGIQKSEWLFITNTSMGNTFSGGLTLIGDASDNRIAMISNEYLTKTLAEHTAANP